MRKKSKSGFTLVEMLVAMLILVCLVIGIGVGMDAGGRVYQDSVFESDSANLAGILNTSLGDILRHSENIRVNPDYFEDSTGSYIAKADVGFVFTSFDYGIQDAYFHIPADAGGAPKGVLKMKNLKNDRVVELINTGAYPKLEISDFKLTYCETGTDSEGNAGRGGYFTIKYNIYSIQDSAKSRSVECVIRRLNG